MAIDPQPGTAEQHARQQQPAVEFMGEVGGAGIDLAGSAAIRSLRDAGQDAPRPVEGAAEAAITGSDVAEADAGGGIAEAIGGLFEGLSGL